MKDKLEIKKLVRLVILIVVIVAIGKILALYLGDIARYFL